jgi:hypothetical protein
LIRSLAISLLRFAVIADRLIGRDIRDDIELPQYTFRRAGVPVARRDNRAPGYFVV